MQNVLFGLATGIAVLVLVLVIAQFGHSVLDRFEKSPSGGKGSK
jgi:hypothetical protein